MRMRTNNALLLFRMKTVIDLKRFIDENKEDLSENGNFFSLLAPEIYKK